MHRSGTPRAPWAAPSLTSFLFILVVNGCASGDPRAELLSDWEPPEHQSCTIHDDPEDLPAVEDLVDADALMAALEDRHADTPGRLLLQLRAENGAWSGVRPIESDLDEGSQEAIGELVLQHLDSRAPARRMRLRLDLTGTSPLLTAGRSRSCAPALRNREEIARLMRELSQGLEASGTVVVHVEVPPDGIAGSVEIGRSSGDRTIDQAAQQAAERMRFHPGHVDRIYAEAFARLPLTFQ